jgi:polysaccharide export outer membrane protein
MRLNQILFAVSLCMAAVAPAQTGDQTAPKLLNRDQRYRLQPNDVVEVQFRYTPEYNLTATIQPDGFITLQVAGDVKIGGLTIADAAAAIVKQAGVRLKDPEVNLVLKDFVKPHFVVAGEVTRPGTFDLRGDVSVIQAIAMSGGFKDTAKQSQVILLRRVNPEYAEVKLLNLRQLMSQGKIREDINLMPDDMLVVPQSRISKLEPYVRLGSMGLYGLSLALR